MVSQGNQALVHLDKLDLELKVKQVSEANQVLQGNLDSVVLDKVGSAVLQDNQVSVVLQAKQVLVVPARLVSAVLQVKEASVVPQVNQVSVVHQDKQVLVVPVKQVSVALVVPKLANSGEPELVLMLELVESVSISAEQE